MNIRALITLFGAVLLSGAVLSPAQAYNFGTGINTNFGTGVGTTFGNGITPHFGASYGQNLDANPAPTPTPTNTQATNNSGSAPEQHHHPPAQVRNHYYLIPWGFGGGNTYSEATPATKASETSTSKSSSSSSASVEASSANLYKISVDLSQFKNNADNVKLSVNNHTIKVYGGKYSQTFQIEKKIVKNGIRKEVSGNTLIIYVPLKD